MERRRLLTLSTHATSPGQRFRIQTWAPYLAAHGIDNVEAPFCTPGLERLLPRPGHLPEKVWHTAASYLRYPFRSPRPSAFDAVLVYREALPLGPPLWESWIGRAGPPLAYDLDDPVFLLPPSAANPMTRWLRDRDKWRRLCESAAVTICINEMIADHLRPFARRVEVVPNALDLDRYPAKPDPTPGAGQSRPEAGSRVAAPVVLGYSGSHSTMAQLREIQGALATVARTERVVLHAVGGAAPFAGDGYEVRERTWTAETEVSLLHELDVGLAPAPEDPWSRYKSFVKVLLYMAVGLPVVASPVGLPARIIRDGENGFLAADSADWVDRLVALARDPALRHRVGSAARATIARDFALSTQLPRVLAIFRGLMGAPGGA